MDRIEECDGGGAVRCAAGCGGVCGDCKTRTAAGRSSGRRTAGITAAASTTSSCSTPEDFTKRQTVNVFANRTEDNETVVNTSSVLVSATFSATSSIGTTYSSEASASFGQKDLFNVVANQTFSTTTTATNAL